MAQVDIRDWRIAESLSHSPIDAPLQYDHRLDCEVDNYYYPPSKYPVREFLTASAFVLSVIVLIVWGGWKLFSLM